MYKSEINLTISKKVIENSQNPRKIWHFLHKEYSCIYNMHQ